MPYVSRSEWTSGRPPKSVTRHPMTSNGVPVSLIVLHHTVTPDEPFYQWLRSVEVQHLNGVYADFAYNGAASNSSAQYTDGRGPTVQGGATGNGVDASSLSIVAVGDFHTGGKDLASDLLVENVAGLIVRWIKGGRVAEDFRLEPHRNFYATACCGDRLVARIPDIKRAVRQQLHGGASAPRRFPMMDQWYKHYNSVAYGTKPDGIVEWYQDGLIRIGYLKGKADGVKGPRTDNAWVSFELDAGAKNPDARPGRYSTNAFRSALDDGIVDTKVISDRLKRARRSIVAAQKLLD